MTIFLPYLKFHTFFTLNCQTRIEGALAIPIKLTKSRKKLSLKCTRKSLENNSYIPSPKCYKRNTMFNLNSQSYVYLSKLSILTIKTMCVRNNSKKHKLNHLKGQCHEIFDPRFYSSNNLMRDSLQLWLLSAEQ
jgi:hypothetical protein